MMIISGTHLFIYLTNTHSQNYNNIAIDKLIDIREQTKAFLISDDLDTRKLKEIFNLYSPEKQIILLKDKFFDVKEICEANTELQIIIDKIIENTDVIDQEQLIYNISNLRNTSQYAITKYRVLLDKETTAIFISQLISFALFLLLVVFLLWYCHRFIIAPLRQLEENVRSISNHRFHVNFMESSNEIGLLSTHLKSMSADLENLITAMQQKVFDKNLQLIDANKNIQFLFDTSQKLNTVELSIPIIKESLNALAKQTNLSKLCLELANGTQIRSDHADSDNHINKHSIPILLDNKPYGQLNYIEKVPGASNNSVIASYSHLIAQALHHKEYTLQEQKLLLVEERGVIARELHDSIAQALSFLKIQCTVLKRQISNHDNNNQDVIDSVNNIKEAIDDAYIQLRSLLSTFRLNINIADLKEAVLAMVTQLQKQTTSHITLGHFDSNFQMHANQQIHLLQIIREATVNAMKHANCNNIVITSTVKDGQVCICITDDGIGVSNTPQKDNHYGMEIMTQRATELEASIEIYDIGDGSKVELIFDI
ncbi:histidine kinase [Psychromonas aquatilis]|uniref:histidine kinase n=1 Tax=Psychromonas aquatilis TaxID=2005072 RepID=A0ABU9GNM7_9GAMM